MAGRVGWIGSDGRRGLCVEIDHGCRLRSTLCGLKEIAVRRGQRLRPGALIGRAGAPGKQSPTTCFSLALGSIDLDPRVLLPAGT